MLPAMQRCIRQSSCVKLLAPSVALLHVSSTRQMRTYAVATPLCKRRSETTIASTDNLIVVLNKADMLPASPAERSARLSRLQTRMRRQLAGTKFAHARFAVTAAATAAPGEVAASAAVVESGGIDADSATSEHGDEASVRCAAL